MINVVKVAIKFISLISLMNVIFITQSIAHERPHERFFHPHSDFRLICHNNCFSDKGYCIRHCDAHEFNCQVYKDRNTLKTFSYDCDFNRAQCISNCEEYHRVCYDNCGDEIIEFR